MKKITLRNLLNLNEKDIDNSKIGLNMKDGLIGETFFDMYKNGTLDKIHLYHNSDKNSKSWKQGLKPGKVVFSFVQMPDNSHRWLLVSVGKCIKPVVIKNHEYYEYEEVEQYSGYIDRLIIDCTKSGFAKSRYMFDLKSFLDVAEIVEILPQEYEPIKFNGYKNVRLKFTDLKLILETEKYTSYKEMLKNVKGVYCLTDTNTGRVYIGSAYGSDGIAQRWDYYKSTKHGGNEMLIKLYEEKGEKYFNNMIFTLIEYFDLSTPEDIVIERENYWKETFSSRVSGLNKN